MRIGHSGGGDAYAAYKIFPSTSFADPCKEAVIVSRFYIFHTTHAIAL